VVFVGAGFAVESTGGTAAVGAVTNCSSFLNHDAGKYVEMRSSTLGCCPFNVTVLSQ